MKLTWNMPRRLRPFYQRELQQYRTYLQKEDLVTAWQFLERAHILGQPYPKEHTAVHYKMLEFGFKIKSWPEVLGQLPRLLIGGIKSWVGIIPVGNTGGANVSAFQPMPIPADLQTIICGAATNLGRE